MTASLKITITATIPLPRNAVDAANEALGISLLVDDLATRLRELSPDNDVTTSCTAEGHEAVAVPAPKRKRRTKAEMRAAVASPHAPPTGSDALAADAGADPGDVPPFLRRTP